MTTALRLSSWLKVPVMTATFIGLAAIAGASGQPTQAQIFPDRVFGCSSPGGAYRETLYGLGNSYNNALIATPAGGALSSFPVQSDIAIFRGFALAGGGYMTGQERCQEVADRLNRFNGFVRGGTTIQAPAPGTYVLGVTYSNGARPVICLQPRGASGCPGLTGVPMTGAVDLNPTPFGPSYTIVPIVNAGNPGAVINEMVGNIGSGFFQTARNTQPAVD